MKKNTLSILFLALTIALSAQSHVDALRYSQHTIGGTARSVAMSGAFGALGGDFSTLSTNPAGLGVYRGSEFTLTPEFYFDKTTSRYFGNEVEEGKFNFNLSNLGYVANFTPKGSMLKAVNFGVGYNRIANFHKNTIIDGVNESTSYGDYMSGRANDFGLESFSSSLFYDAYVIDDDTVNGGYKLNDYDDGYIYEDINGELVFRPTEQRITNEEKGKINEWAFSLGFNFNDILFIGGTIGIQPVYYESQKSWKEYDPAETATSFQYFDYKESLKVQGTGYTGKLGLILKPIPALRLGLAIHLPVTYNLREEYSTSIWSRYINQTYKPVDANGNEIDFNESVYKVVSPFKTIGSAAFVLGKFLVLSTDLEFMDYSKMRMRSNEIDFDWENEDIKIIYKNAVNFKFGSELRLGKTYYRGGFGYYGSPYAPSEENNDAFRMSYSGGFGIRDEKFFFDIAYQYTNYDERTILYSVNVNDVIDTPIANKDNKVHRVMTTIGFRF